MVKNVTGGNRAKKQKRGGFKKKEIIDEVDTGQMFGLIIEQRGGNHVTVLCSDNIQRIGRLGGATRRGQKFVAGIYVVVALWEFETEQTNCDVLAIANPPADVRNIFKKINPSRDDDDVFEFQEEDSKFADLHESTNMIKVSSTTINTSSSKPNNNINFADFDDETTENIKSNQANDKPANFLSDVFEIDDDKIADQLNKLSLNKEEEEYNFDDI